MTSAPKLATISDLLSRFSAISTCLAFVAWALWSPFTHIHDGDEHTGIEIVHSHFKLHLKAISSNGEQAGLDDFDPPAHYLDLGCLDSQGVTLIPAVTAENLISLPVKDLCVGNVPEAMAGRGPPGNDHLSLRSPPSHLSV